VVAASSSFPKHHQDQAMRKPPTKHTPAYCNKQKEQVPLGLGVDASSPRHPLLSLQDYFAALLPAQKSLPPPPPKECIKPRTSHRQSQQRRHSLRQRGRRWRERNDAVSASCRQKDPSDTLAMQIESIIFTFLGYRSGGGENTAKGGRLD